MSVVVVVAVQVKVLYVRNLKSDVTEDQLREKFEQHGKVERVKKVKDYGFIHFEDRDSALHAMELLNGTVRQPMSLCLDVCLLHSVNAVSKCGRTAGRLSTHVSK